ncbi:MAG: hypothetical protein O7H41_09920 [Planctomycetota bacterium]|nr:hypothetical protein [Planctomycetota bacterium]
MKWRLTILVALALCGAGCQTTVGNYLANRGRDLGECFRLEVGGGFGLGVSVKAAGIVHLGMAGAVVPRLYGAGWNYGKGHAFGHGYRAWWWDWDIDLTMASPVWGTLAAFDLLPPVHPETNQVVPFHVRFRTPRPMPTMGTEVEHACWAIVPPLLIPDELPHQALFGPQTREEERRARVHDFDIEVAVYAGFVYARAGFSPGEFADFILGWFGVDLAHDDRPIGTPGTEEDLGGIGDNGDDS